METLKKHTVSIVAGVILLALGGAALATNGFGLFSGQIEIANVENLVINNPSPDSLGGATMFGATFVESQSDLATSTTDFTQLASLSVWDLIRYGDDPVIDQNSVSVGYLFCDFADATTTPCAIKNTTGKSIYITDWAIELEGLSTTTMSFFLGTTTDGFVNVADAETNPTNYITGLSDDIIVTDGSARDATSTVLWYNTLYDPSEHGYGVYMQDVPVPPGSYVTLHASSTTVLSPQIFEGGNLFDGKMFLQYRFLE